MAAWTHWGGSGKHFHSVFRRSRVNRNLLTELEMKGKEESVKALGAPGWLSGESACLLTKSGL